MKKLIFIALIVTLLLLSLSEVYALTGPNEYAARIAEAQADIETARAIQDLSLAVNTQAKGLNRVSFMQALTLFLLAFAFCLFVAFVLYQRSRPTQPAPHPVQPAPLPTLETPPTLTPGIIDPQMVNNLLALKILEMLGQQQTPRLPDYRPDLTAGKD